MIIQKFGGVAMKNEEMRLRCIEHIKAGLNQYGKVIAVVSAIGRQGDPYATDSLLKLTPAFAEPTVATDLAAACGELIATAVLSAELSHAGIDNTLLHGGRTGILTTGNYGDGKIAQIDPSYILSALEQTYCTVIPGFQGMDSEGQLQTLGRGGSDLTAIAIGAAVNASHVEFFKDVPGVMTHDPNEVDSYSKLDFLTFDEFLPLLDGKRPIIQKRAAQYAIKKGIPLYIRGITGNATGTWIQP